MSKYDYEVSKEIDQRGYPFYALIMACMRKADDINLQKLREVFPTTFNELQARYNTPGGTLPEDTNN